MGNKNLFFFHFKRRSSASVISRGKKKKKKKKKKIFKWNYGNDFVGGESDLIIFFFFSHRRRFGFCRHAFLFIFKVNWRLLNASFACCVFSYIDVVRHTIAAACVNNLRDVWLTQRVPLVFKWYLYQISDMKRFGQLVLRLSFCLVYS